MIGTDSKCITMQNPIDNSEVGLQNVYRSMVPARALIPSSECLIMPTIPGTDQTDQKQVD
ncbi:MAG: hypothetical protein ETSY2_43400 [Candidatus Entotheonella gemina]|uniref:Uncharacterized protein n=1 Tax=Candidatus Entotheonella gemina TaxID=1429439 RepID=W4LJB2_9BACT|nr:MAG: hypothetical protein ETSY2_43400 [Candidatus Entotheonella gemina]